MIRAVILSGSLLALAVPAEAKPTATQPAARVAAANKAALLEPSSAAFVRAVQIYPYTEGALYRLYAAPQHLTDIAFQPGETLHSVAAGATVRWTGGDPTRGSGARQPTPTLDRPPPP